MFSSLRRKITVATILAVTVIFAGFIVARGRERQRTGTRRAQRDLVEIALHQTQQIDLALQAAAAVSESTASFLSDDIHLSEPQIYRHLQRSISRHPIIYGAALAFEPQKYNGRRRFCPYVCRRRDVTGRPESKLTQIDIAGVYDYTRWDWYRDAVRAGKGVWSPPYFDSGAGNIRMSTFSVPFYNGRELCGVATVDIALPVLNQTLHWPQWPGVEFFVIGHDGTYVFHHFAKRIVKDSLFAEAKRGNAALLPLARAMVAKQQGIEEVTWNQSREWVAYAPIPSANWSLGVRMPVETAMLPVASDINVMLAYTLIPLVVIIVFIHGIVGWFLRPLSDFNQAAQQIAHGGLELSLDTKRQDELGDLATSFTQMAERLRAREQVLRESRGDRLAQMLEGLEGKFFCYSMRPGGELEYVSPSVETVLGYPQEAFKRVFRTILTDNQINIAAQIYGKAVLRGESPPVYEIEYLHRDGSTRRLEVCERPLLDDLANVVSVEGLVSDVTERVRATEWFRGLIEASPDGIVITDQAGTIVLVNRQTEQIYGYDREELVGKSAEMLRPAGSVPADSRATWNTLEKNRQDLGDSMFELRGLCKNGAEFPIELSQRPLLLDSERGELVSTTIRDVTARRQAERDLRESQQRLVLAVDALRESESRLSKTTENAPCLIFQFMLRPDGTAYFPYASAWLKVYCGLEPEELREDASPILSLFHPDDVPGYLAAVQHAVLNRELFQHEWRFLFPDGRITWVQATSRPEFLDDGRILYSGVLMDISERKKAEAMLRESEKRFKSILDNMQGGYLRADNSGRIQYTNPGMARILGYASAQELLGKSIAHDLLVNPEDRVPLLEALREHGEIENYELLFKRRDGSPVVVEDNVHFLYDEAGDPVGVEGLLRDVTERKQVEEALQNAKQAADESNRAKSDFLANMSHEIRTPMNAVLGMTHLALQTELSPQQRTYLHKIDISARNLLGIINDILDFSKIEAGKLQVEAIEFNLEEVLRHISDTLALKAHDKKLELHFRWDPGVPALLVGDPLRIGQVLINLVGNAVKFTERGEVEVAVERMAEANPDAVQDDGVKLRFAVRDTGIGLTEEQLGRLFQAFSQADSSTTRRYGGTGLGLTICKRLVELMGGEISVQSLPGQGSIFAFTLKLPHQKTLAYPERQLQGTLDGVRAPVVDDNATSRHLTGYHVLLVEDNEINRDVAQEILSRAGVRVTVADDGEKGIGAVRAAALAGAQFDAVLMDCHMPVLDGYAATRLLRQDERFQSLPIIAMTANAMAGDREKCLAAGMNDHVSKPINLDHLFTVLTRWIKPARGHGEVEPELASMDSEVSATDGARLQEPLRTLGLPGVDWGAGLGHVNGNGDLYRKILGKFAQGQTGAVQKIQGALRAGDRELATRLAHTLKGVAGNIGAGPLFDTANQVEVALRDGQTENLTALLRTLDDQLEPLVQAIMRKIATRSAGASVPEDGETGAHGPAREPDFAALNKAAIGPLLEQLEVLLEKANTGADTVIAQLRPLLRGTRYAVTVDAMAASVGDYDFETAASHWPELADLMRGSEAGH